MLKPYSAGIRDPLGRVFVVPQGVIVSVEHILWSQKILVYQAHLSATHRKFLISNAPGENSAEKFLLLDRNLISYASELFSEEPRDPEARKMVLAVLLYMHLCRFTPSALSALHEFESQNPGITAHEDAVACCQSLAASVETYVKLFKGEIKHLTIEDIPPAMRSIDFIDPNEQFTFPPSWLWSYAAVLKLALLERDTTLNKVGKMKSFLEWIHHKLFFSPPFWFVASHFLGARHGKSIIKRVGTSDLTELKKNAQNAAWDLNLLFEWLIKLRAQQFCVLASRDKSLRMIAARMRDTVLAKPGHARSILSVDWPNPKDVDCLMDVMNRYHANLDDSSRPANQGLSREYYPQLIDSLEKELGLPLGHAGL